MTHINHESDLDFNDRILDSPNNKKQVPLLNRKLTINKNSVEQVDMAYFNQIEPFSANQVSNHNRTRVDSGISDNYSKHINS